MSAERTRETTTGVRIAVGIVAGVGLAAASAMARLRRYEIAEGSMTPILQPGDFTIAVARRSDIQRGDIVVYNDPDRTDFELVKRVIALPGERVSIIDGHVWINEIRADDPWGAGPTLVGGQMRHDTHRTTWDLDETVFVLGDNRASSAGDSRTIVPIPTNHIRYRLRFRYWPLPTVGPL